MLLIDDGTHLRAEDIAETVPHMEGLALVVVDRLQAAHNARLPLSGDRLPEASQVLAGLARSVPVAVLAVVDSDDPALLGLLDADVLVTLTATADPDKVQVTVTERDVGTIGTAYLRPDLIHARFLDAGAAPLGRAESPAIPAVPGFSAAGATAALELAEAALAYTSGGHRGIPAALTRELAAWRSAVAGGDQEALKEILPSLLRAAAAVGEMPDTHEGYRLAAALRPYGEAMSADTADTAAGAGQAAADGLPVPAPPGSGQTRVDTAAEDEEGDEDGLAPGDEEDEPEGHVFPALKILKDAVGRSKMHPISVIRTEERDSGPWPLISEHMDGEPRWVHPDVTAARVPHVRANGKRVRRDKIDVPGPFGAGVLCLIDRNGSFLRVFGRSPRPEQAPAHRPARRVRQDPGRHLSHRHPGMDPHRHAAPAGADHRPARRARPGVGHHPHIKQLERLVRERHLGAMPAIHDSWTGKYNESLFKPFYEATRKARTELVQIGGDPYKAYKTRLSIALRLLWPKRPAQRSPFWRPDWRMSMVAEASVRHWTVAFKAVQEGHTLIALRNVDQAVFWTAPGTPPATYRIGTGFGEVKAKFVQSGEIILEGDD